jgi:cytochrome c biogenesis factor
LGSLYKLVQLSNRIFFVTIIVWLFYGFNLNRIFHSGVLYFNDSLLVLYILSSAIFTILFFYIILNYLCLKNLNKFGNLGFISVSCLILYFLNSFIKDVYVINVFQIPALNTTLQNGLLNIHPFLIYYIYGCMTLMWYYSYRYDTFRLMNFLGISVYFNITIIILNGVYLGALWASQELNWGGFWSWDPVELISLILLFIFVNKLHSSTNYLFNKSTTILIVTFCLIYLVIRLGAITSIHSFIRTNNSPIYVTWLIFGVGFGVIINYMKYQLITIKIFWGKQYFYKYIITLCVGLVYSFIIYSLCAGIFFFLNNYIWRQDSTYLIIMLVSIFIVVINRTTKLEFFLCVTCVLLGFCILGNELTIVLVFFLVLNQNMLISKHFHTGLAFVYLLFSIFFITLTCYTLTSSIAVLRTVTINNTSSSQHISSFYEATFYLMKQHFVERFKNMMHHVTGFNIITNNAMSLYSYSTNFKLKTLFTIEYVYIILFIYLIFLLIFFKNFYLNVIRTFIMY